MARKQPPPPNRQAISVATLRAAGGRRVSVNLPADVAAKVDRAMERNAVGQTEVILRALRRI